MAGTLTISTLKDSSGVLATQNGMTGIAKAWVNFNGTGTVAIVGSFNVSSITDNGTGDYTINFTTAMPNATYSVILTLTDTTATNGPTAIIKSGGTFTSSACQVMTVRYSSGNYDPSIVCASFFSS
jgi:hypothetical protein